MTKSEVLAELTAIQKDLKNIIERATAKDSDFAPTHGGASVMVGQATLSSR